MSKLLMIATPVIAVVIAFGFKLPHRLKKQFFRVPIWISSTAVAFIVGHMVHGVFGPIATLIMDMLLAPAFWLIKKHTDWISSKEETQGLKALPT